MVGVHGLDPIIEEQLNANGAKFDVEEYDIVQLSPTSTGNKWFSGCLLVVTDVYEWGVQGYVVTLNDPEKPGVPYYRAKWSEIEHTGGRVCWGIQ